MSHTTAANCVNTELRPSRWLLAGNRGLYLLVAGIVFAASGLPLEANTIIVILLLREQRLSEILLLNRRGAFSLHIDGTCRLENEVYQVKRVSFLSTLLIVLELDGGGKKQRLLLSADAFPPDVFRHLSRICLCLNCEPSR